MSATAVGENGGLLVVDEGLAVRHAEELRVAYANGQQNVRALVFELFAVNHIHELIELAERMKVEQAKTATAQPDDVLITLIECNAKLAETIAAQADQIVALSKRSLSD